jgi:hypothetical protein
MISHGHSFHAIQDYTLDQFDRLLTSVQKLEHDRFTGQIYAARLAQADQKSFRKVTQELARGNE